STLPCYVMRASLATPLPGIRPLSLHDALPISGMGFAGYFLIVADFIKWAKASDIPVGPGRGSGAGSVVAWSLTITDLDPMALGLLFARSLNPERVPTPDFDIDLCQTHRDTLTTHLRQKSAR